MAALTDEDLAPYRDLIIITETANGATIEPLDDSAEAHMGMKAIALLVYRAMAKQACYGYDDDEDDLDG